MLGYREDEEEEEEGLKGSVRMEVPRPYTTDWEVELRAEESPLAIPSGNWRAEEVRLELCVLGRRGGVA